MRSVFWRAVFTSFTWWCSNAPHTQANVLLLNIHWKGLNYIHFFTSYFSWRSLAVLQNFSISKHAVRTSCIMLIVNIGYKNSRLAFPYIYLEELKPNFWKYVPWDQRGWKGDICFLFFLFFSFFLLFFFLFPFFLNFFWTFWNFFKDLPWERMKRWWASWCCRLLTS